jgi:DNA-binding Xre family transcriptional regulator
MPIEKLQDDDVICLLGVVRRQCKISQEDLAAIVGSNVKTIQKLEQGKWTGITRQLMISLCIELNCEVHELFIRRKSIIPD